MTPLEQALMLNPAEHPSLRFRDTREAWALTANRLAVKGHYSTNYETFKNRGNRRTLNAACCITASRRVCGMTRRDMARQNPSGEFHEDKPPGSLVSPALSSFILHVLVLKNQMSLDNISLVHHHGLQGLLSRWL
jgi:hypothetical protein